MTAREECKQFNNFIREKGEFAMTTRQVPLTTKQASQASETPRLASASYENMSANNSTLRNAQAQQQIAPHAHIRHMNRNRTQTQF